MNWNQSKSLLLSKLCICVFSALLLVLDLGGPWAARWFVGLSHALEGSRDTALLLTTLYGGSVLAWTLLWALWRLLGGMRGGAVFTAQNVRYLRLSAWCCFGAAALLALSAVYYVPFVLLALLAAFVGLIIRVVKNVFAQALAMQDELDFTI